MVYFLCSKDLGPWISELFIENFIAGIFIKLLSLKMIFEYLSIAVAWNNVSQTLFVLLLINILRKNSKTSRLNE